MKKFFLIILLLGNIVLGQMIYNGVGHIQQNQQVEWYKAGLLSGWSKQAIIKIDVSQELGNNINAKIESAIIKSKDYTNLGESVILYFPNNTYYFYDQVERSPADSNLIFQGESQDVVFDFSNVSNLNNS